ncbi:YjfB family protein [Bacillus suaedae]|uniref:YjfB family protein n=1 Tax=Halalkalibacter suaedae TaxID=2822140 RepID=A0A941ANC0_9BACI|nr:YjfB family protein [Bacillus suaedae]MBP3950157.1 YjfB family protein [Bacillus suaedae]
MDIALLSMALSQGKAQQQASISIMKKAMGTAEQQGDALQKLMGSADATAIQQAAQPHLGGSIDIKL